MRKLSGFGRRAAPAVGAACTLSLLAAATAISPARASDRWEEAAGGAVVILPVPQKAKGFVGGSLACAEQRWVMRLRTESLDALPTPLEATITIDADASKAAAVQDGNVVSVPAAAEIIDGLKTGSRLAIAFGKGKAAPSVTFSLKGSKAAIEAVAPRCSQIDMAGYDRIGLVEFGPAVEQARPLMAEEAGLFAAATKKEPTLAAASVQLDESRAVLFASLCGSTWYYGRSGCTLAAFVRATSSGVWQAAYSSEGVAVYLDPKASNGGWPNLVTLPLVGGTEASHWVWTGLAYELKDHLVAEEDQISSEGDADQ